MTALALMTEDEVATYGRAGDAGFGALETERGLLPLTAMDVDARVAGVIASIELAQTFVNTTGVAIEATYIFPMPDRAAVHRFRMEVAGRVIEGVVDERGAAREQYDQAIAAGHRAAITEEERAGVFTLRVGNLMPGETATVRLSLVGPLPVDDGEVTLRFPLVVAPRYMPGTGLPGDAAGLGTAVDTNLVPDASRISPPVLLPGCPNPVRLGIRVAIEDAHARDFASSLHAITTANRTIEVQPGARLDRDFILRWRVDGAELASSLVCADDADGRAGSFMLTLVPPSTTSLAAKPRDVVFVIDRSGSMDGWKMVAARRAAARMIDTLTSRDRFCAIAFDNAVELLPEANLVSATDRNRFRAVEALSKVDARGGTELAAPLHRALALLGAGYDDRERVVVLVTDGQVGNEDHILRELAPIMRNVRMFTLGIDQAVNAAFLRRLAGAGGGLCELVESEDRLDAVMAKVHRRIGTPIATDLALRAIGLDVEGDTIAPKKLPDVYAGAPVVLLGRYRGAAPAKAAFEVDGTSFGDAFHMTIARTGEPRPSAWLGASWARARIRDLEDRYAAGSRELEAEIVKVSKQFGVLSRFTAYLAIDRNAVVNPGGQIRQVVQRVEKPAGWDLAASAPRGGGGMAAPALGGLADRSRAHMPPSRSPMRAVMQKQSFEASASAPPAPPLSPPPRSAPRMQAPIVVQPPRITKSDDAPVTAVAYLTTLAELARELQAKVGTPAIRLVRQRLREWIEDVRSVGLDEALAAAVEQLDQRLSAAIASHQDAEVRTIATELARLATGAPPPKPSRLAFWK